MRSRVEKRFSFPANINLVIGKLTVRNKIMVWQILIYSGEKNSNHFFSDLSIAGRLKTF